MVGEAQGAIGRRVESSEAQGLRRRWEQIAATGYCRRPVRLSGRSVEVDSDTGEVVRRYSTEDEPDGVLLVACNNRRASVCPPCSKTYSRDAWQLVAAGLRGGKGVQASVAEHPTVFATLTAPSFGAVHAARRDEGGDPLLCRPRRQVSACKHGEQDGCWEHHETDADEVGQPLCEECFDYEALVVWNASLSELWRRTTIYLRRHLASRVGVSLRDLPGLVTISYIKVVEYQARGAVHVHAVMRLDGAGKEPPPAEFHTDLLTLALLGAAQDVALRIDGSQRSWFIHWGTQLDVRSVTGRASEDSIGHEAVAGYLAKYATKSVDQFGDLERIRGERHLDLLVANPHIVHICRTAWKLGGDPRLEHLALRRWAHALGFRGHWSSKSRHYSTTFKALREARREHARLRTASDQEAGAVDTVGIWRYSGMGYGSIDPLSLGNEGVGG